MWKFKNQLCSEESALVRAFLVKNKCASLKGSEEAYVIPDQVKGVEVDGH